MGTQFDIFLNLTLDFLAKPWETKRTSKKSVAILVLSKST